MKIGYMTESEQLPARPVPTFWSAWKMFIALTTFAAVCFGFAAKHEQASFATGLFVYAGAAAALQSVFWAIRANKEPHK